MCYIDTCGMCGTFQRKRNVWILDPLTRLGTFIYTAQGDFCVNSVNYLASSPPCLRLLAATRKLPPAIALEHITFKDGLVNMRNSLGTLLQNHLIIIIIVIIIHVFMYMTDHNHHHLLSRFFVCMDLTFRQTQSGSRKPPLICSSISKDTRIHTSPWVRPIISKKLENRPYHSDWYHH